MQHPKELIKGSKGLEIRSKCHGGKIQTLNNPQKNQNGLHTDTDTHTQTHTCILIKQKIFSIGKKSSKLPTHTHTIKPQTAITFKTCNFL